MFELMIQLKTNKKQILPLRNLQYVTKSQKQIHNYQEEIHQNTNINHSFSLKCIVYVLC